MLINGTVHRAANSQSGTERWTAKCLLCEWLQGGGHLYRTKKSANLGIVRHLRIVHNLRLNERQVAEY